MQLTNSRSLGYSPYEVVHKRSPFDPLQREIEISTKLLKRVKEQKEYHNRRRNKSRNVNFKYQLGDTVMKRIPVRTKYDDYFEGPFKITKIDASGNVVLIKGPKREIRTNIGHIRPLSRGGRMS